MTGTGIRPQWMCAIFMAEICRACLDKMDYLEQLGMEVIYFNPLFVSPSNHKYDSQDYDHVDPHCGKIVKDGGRLLEDWETDNTHADRYITRVTTDSENLEASDRLLIRVIEEAHKRGIRVILDGVFNHCGSFNKWLDRERIYENKPGYEKGAYISRRTVHIMITSVSMMITGSHIIRPMMDGGATIHFPS